MEVPKEVLDMMDEKDSKEKRIAELSDFLRHCPGNPGVTGPLVDEGGFPRADIDIYAVRNARHELALLNTDHVQLLNKIETAIHELHSKFGPIRVERPKAAAPQVTPTANACSTEGTPFAVVTIVEAKSPAAESGLKVGDDVICFGDIRLGSETHQKHTLQQLFDALPVFVASHLNMNVDVVVSRETAGTRDRLILQFRPRRWEGRGLLGCRLEPIKLATQSIN